MKMVFERSISRMNYKEDELLKVLLVVLCMTDVWDRLKVKVKVKLTVKESMLSDL